jgi:hypothetical protein
VLLKYGGTSSAIQSEMLNLERSFVEGQADDTSLSRQAERLFDLLASGEFGDPAVSLRKSVRETIDSFFRVNRFLFKPHSGSISEVYSCSMPKAMIAKWLDTSSGGPVRERLHGGAKDFYDRVQYFVGRCSSSFSKGRPNYESPEWPSFLALNSGWYLRRSLMFKFGNQLPVFTLCLIRALELVLLASAVRAGSAQFSPDTGNIVFSDGPLHGCGALITKFRERKIRCAWRTGFDLDEWARRAYRVLGVRNQCSLTHGAMDIAASDADAFYIEVKSLIGEIVENDLKEEVDRTFTELRGAGGNWTISDICARSSATYVSFSKQCN